MNRLLLLLLLAAPSAAETLSWRFDTTPIRVYSWERTVLEGAETNPGLPTRPGCVVTAESFARGRPGTTSIDAFQPSPELWVMRGLLASTADKKVKKKTKWGWKGALTGLSGELQLKVEKLSDEAAVISFQGQARVQETGTTTRPTVDIQVSGELRFDIEAGAISELFWRQQYAWNNTDGVAQLRSEELRSVPARAASLTELVEASIETGRAALLAELETMRKRYRTSRLDHQALFAFALLRAGLDPKHPQLEGVFADIIAQRASTGSYEFLRTYGLSLYIMALEARFIERVPPEVIEGLATQPRFERLGIDPNDLELMRQATDELLRWRIPNSGAWGYGPVTDQAGRGDNSNSQFAILGLHSAQRSGIVIDAAVWPELDHWWRSNIASATGVAAPLRLTWMLPDVAEIGASGSTAEDDSFTGSYPPIAPKGWAYTMASRSGAYLSMTGAGLSSLATIRDGLGMANAVEDLQRDSEIMQGLSGLAGLLRFERDTAVALGGHFYYYALYSLEKALDMLAVEVVNDFDWYSELAQWLLGSQAPEGYWLPHRASASTRPEYGVDTSFALLVLTRATLASNPEFSPGMEIGRMASGDDTAPDVVYVEELNELISLNGAISMLVQGGRGEEAKKAEKALKYGIEHLAPENRPAVIPKLLELTESNDSGHRRLASRALKDVAKPVKAKPEPLAALYEAWRRLREAAVPDSGADPAGIRDTLLDADAHPSLRMMAAIALVELEGRAAADPLLYGMQDKDEDLREVCVTQLRRATGRAFGFEADGAKSARQEAIDAWNAWLATGD